MDLAVGLVGLGYCPMPIGREKRPLVKWGACHVTPPTWRVLYNDWWPAWNDARGVGLIAGRPHGLVVVDADDEASWSWALANLPAVRGTRTRRGGHLHFAHPPNGIIGNRSGVKAVTPAPDVRLDVKGLAGFAVAPYSLHPSGFIYQPLGDWLRPVSELPVLPAVIVRQAEDKPPAPPRRTTSMLKQHPAGPESDLDAYLTKWGVPAEGSGSDDAVFRAASWCKTNLDVSEGGFVAAVRRCRPEFDEAWILTKWRSATGRRK